MRHRAALAVLLVLAAPAALAAVSDADRDFLAHEARGGAYELAIAQLAAQKATRDDIKAYAQRIVSEHGQANATLQQLARSKGLLLPAGGMTNDEQTRFAGLQNLQGTDLDRAYVEEAVRTDAEDKRDLAQEAKTTHDPEIRTYVQDVSTKEAQHEQAVKQLRAGS